MCTLDEADCPRNCLRIFEPEAGRSRSSVCMATWQDEIA